MKKKGIVSKIREIMKNHVSNNSKEYIIVSLIFLIGIFLGVMFINNMEEAKKSEIGTYMNSFVEKLKNTEQLNNIELLKTSIWQNIILAVTIWFFRNYCNWNTSSIWSNTL